MNDQISLEPTQLDAMDPHHDDALLTTTTTTTTSNNTCSTSTPARSRDDDSRHDAVNQSATISEPQVEPCSFPDVGTSTDHSIPPLHDSEPQPQPQPRPQQEQEIQQAEESANLLAAILDELEMERARRIQAELNLSEYQQQQQKQQKQKQEETRNEEHGMYNAHASLIVAHEIHATFFAESLTVSKKQLSLWKLSTFFQNICEKILPCHDDDEEEDDEEEDGGHDDGDDQRNKKNFAENKHQDNHNHPRTQNATVTLSSEYKKTREKLIQEAIRKVYKDLNKQEGKHDHSTSALASRLIRTRVDYDEQTLKAVLSKICHWLIQNLQEDWKQDYAFRQRYQIWIRGRNAEKRKYKREIKRLTTERNEYRSLLMEKFMCDNDAVTLACKCSKVSSAGCLALHQVLFLEIMPWDDRVKDYIYSRDEVYQWQIWDNWKKKWSDAKVKNVGFFQKLPITKMQGEFASPSKSVLVGGIGDDSVGRMGVADPVVAKDNRSRSSPVKKIQHAFDSLGLKGRFLTNMECSCILDLTEGYPLPNCGTWEWVGNWSLLSSTDSTQSSGRQYDAARWQVNARRNEHEDEVGWVYADDLDALCCKDAKEHSGEKAISTSVQTTSKFRRRTWMRERVLVSYPGISPATKQMLEMNAHNTRLTFAMSKLHGQVHDMQMKLFQKEEELEVLQEERTMDEKLSKNVKEVNTSLASQEEDHVGHHPQSDGDTTTNLQSKTNNIGEKENENSSTSASTVSISPLIRLDDMETFENGYVYSSHDANSERTKDENTTQTDETSKETDPPHMAENQEQAYTMMVREGPSDKVPEGPPKRFDNYSSWIMNSDFILESMKHNVQNAKHSVQTISKKAQDIIVNSKATR